MSISIEEIDLAPVSYMFLLRVGNVLSVIFLFTTEYRSLIIKLFPVFRESTHISYSL